MGADLPLLLGEEAERHGAGEVRIKQASPLGLELGEQAPVRVEASLAVGLDLLKGLEQAAFECGDPLGVEADGPRVVAGYRVLVARQILQLQ